MNENSDNTKRMLGLVRRVMASGADDEAELNEEHLALLAEGRGDLLDEADRRRLLDRIACDPEAGALLADLSAIEEIQSASVGGSSRIRLKSIARSLAIGWAAAACMLIAVGAWRVARPPVPIGPDGKIIQRYAADPARPDYYDQLQRQRLERQARWDPYRDYALCIAVGACLVMSIGLVVCLILVARRPAIPAAHPVRSHGPPGP